MRDAIFTVTLLTLVWSSGPVRAQEPAPGDEWLTTPVDDQTFETYLQFFVYDRNLPFDVQVIDESEEGGIRKEHLSFRSTLAERVFANLYRSRTLPSSGWPAVIVLHGGVARGKDSGGARRITGELTRLGFGVLAMDMEHFGERDTGLLTTFTEGDKHERLYNQEDVYLAWMVQTVKDVGRSLDLLVERGADPGRIAVFGFSRGAVAATVAAGADRRLSAAVLSYGGHFDRLEDGHLPAACPANYVGRISPRPLLMLNGTNDADFVKETSVDPMFRLAKEPKQVLWTDGGHGRASEENRAAMHAWLQERLK
jgi:dienelactone hydrolase